MKTLFASAVLLASFAHARPLLNHVCNGAALDGSEVRLAVETYIASPSVDVEKADVMIRIEDRSPDDQTAVPVERTQTQGYPSWEIEGIGYELTVIWFDRDPVAFYHGMEFPEQSILLECQKRHQ